MMRTADPSKGDKRTVEVMCSMCRNPRSYLINKSPRYEIGSGKSVNERSFCRYCQTLKKITSVPVDTSMPSRNYSTILSASKRDRARHGDLAAEEYLAKTARRQKGLRRMRRGIIREALTHGGEIALGRQTAQKNEVHARRHRRNQIQDGEQLNQMNVLDLAHRIKSKGYSAGTNSTKADLVARGKAILGSTASQFSEIELEPRKIRNIERHVQPKTREELSGMHCEDLNTWIHNRGFAVQSGLTWKRDMIATAEAIWDLGEQQSPPGNLLLAQAKTLKRNTVPQERGDLNQMHLYDLRAWIRPKGFSAGPVMKKEDLILRAETIWDLAGQQPPQVDLRPAKPTTLKRGTIPEERGDLGWLGKRDLLVWIKSKGHNIRNNSRLKKDLPARAQEISDAVGKDPSEVNVRDAESKGGHLTNMGANNEESYITAYAEWQRGSKEVITKGERE